VVLGGGGVGWGWCWVEVVLGGGDVGWGWCWVEDGGGPGLHPAPLSPEPGGRTCPHGKAQNREEEASV